MASFSGKAINISETTAAHAMSYKITSSYCIPHGHAVAICMNAILNNCKVKSIFNGLDIAKLFNEAVEYFDLSLNVDIADKSLKEFVDSVNPIRLKNFPYSINVKKCYESIFKLCN